MPDPIPNTGREREERRYALKREKQKTRHGRSRTEQDKRKDTGSALSDPCVHVIATKVIGFAASRGMSFIKLSNPCLGNFPS
jgi:hypothetical protein